MNIFPPWMLKKLGWAIPQNLPSKYQGQNPDTLLKAANVLQLMNCVGGSNVSLFMRLMKIFSLSSNNFSRHSACFWVDCIFFCINHIDPMDTQT